MRLLPSARPTGRVRFRGHADLNKNVHVWHTLRCSTSKGKDVLVFRNESGTKQKGLSQPDVGQSNYCMSTNPCRAFSYRDGWNATAPGS
jgi:hypothetical protein